MGEENGKTKKGIYLDSTIWEQAVELLPVANARSEMNLFQKQ